MPRGISALRGLGVFLVMLAACARPEPPRLGPAPRLPEQKARVRRTPPPPEWYWEPVEADIRETPPLELPLAENGFRRLEGAARVWDELPTDARERLRRDGVLVLGSDVATLTPPTEGAPRHGFGAFYSHLREQRVPHVVTVDALFALAHVGLTRALATVEDTELAPAVTTLLERVEARLSAEQAGVGTELAEPYRIARGIVGVARALAAPRQPPPKDLAAIAFAERELVEGAGGPATSPLLGITIDYARFAAPDAAAHPGAFRALAWLGTAPLTLASRSEAAGSPITTTQARTNARAAMLLARVCDHDVDPAIHDTYARIQRLLAFVWGNPDDISLTELDDVAEAAGIDLTNPKNIANVVRVDKVRQRAIAGRSPAIYDGVGGVGRGAASVRVFGGHAPIDSTVLQSLAANGLPSTSDLGTWLGTADARKLLDEGSLHASVHGSTLDALIAWAHATPGGVARSAAAERMRVESLLSAWTLTREAGQPLARSRPSPAGTASELRVSGQPLPVLVEALPEVIGRLAATVRQVRRGLGAVGSLNATSPAATSLVEIEDVLRVAFTNARHAANGEPATAEDAAALASLPARIARLEEESADEGNPGLAIVYSDGPGRRAVATATGKIEPVLLVARPVAAEDPLLVVGAHVAHHEVVEAVEAAPKPGKPATFFEVHPSLAPAKASGRGRASWVTTFRWTRP